MDGEKLQLSLQAVLLGETLLEGLRDGYDYVSQVVLPIRAFFLHGEAQYIGQSVFFPELPVQPGDSFVVHEDEGDFGMIQLIVLEEFFQQLLEFFKVQPVSMLLVYYFYHSIFCFSRRFSFSSSRNQNQDIRSGDGRGCRGWP